jgi:hypothetical protein
MFIFCKVTHIFAALQERQQVHYRAFMKQVSMGITGTFLTKQAIGL